MVIFIITLVYLIVQILISCYDDIIISRYFWLEHKGIKDLIDAGKPEISMMTPVFMVISDHHFWILRIILISIILLTFYYRGRDDMKYIFFRNITVSTLITLVLISGILTWSLKFCVGRPRPYTLIFEYMPFSLSTRFHSFPSGHTTEAFSYVIPYIFFCKKYFIRAILLFYGIFVSFTRIILSCHYISDVFFGVYITVISGILISSYVNNRYCREDAN